MARIALFHFVGSFFFSFRSLSGEQKEPREEETPLCPILLRGWVEKHEEVSAGCWSASHSSRQKEECPRCFCRKRLQCRLKGIITGLIVVCFNAVICDPWDSVGRAWITKSLSRLLDFFASWQSLSLFFLGFFFQFLPATETLSRPWNAHADQWGICLLNMSRFLTGNPPLLLAVSGIRLNELSDLSARAFSLSFSRMKRARGLLPQPEVYAFCFIIFSMISTIWPPQNHVAPH